MTEKRIDGRAKTVSELLTGARYSVDFYQREYAWTERQVSELIEDLTGKFLDSYDRSHEREAVSGYGHYFLGSIVVSHKRQQRFIVDGQQRLTTLTLLLIYLYHALGDREQAGTLRQLIFSEKYGRKSFNLDVPDRLHCMDKLFAKEPFDASGAVESVQNLDARYRDIVALFPDEDVDDRALPYFVDWLLENVHLVEIEAYSDADAYTIFETMNDRGLSLSYPEMLKGYVLANIENEADQRRINDLWKVRIQELKALGKEEDTDFFKNWLRARHAESIRQGKKGAENKDYERIGTEFHRWVRDQQDELGLTKAPAFVRFVDRELDFYATQTVRIREAARAIVPGLESVRYNEDRTFTLQTQAMLAALDPGDDPEVVKQKLGLVADYLDIWLARRVWNFRTIAQSSIRYTLFTLTKDLRGKSVKELSTHLRGLLSADDETFASNPDLRLHQTNYRQVRHILARLTHWLDTKCEIPSHFEDLISEGRARPFEIEHIWPDKYERFSDTYKHPRDFEAARNHLGGLVLLQRGPNQSLGDKPFEEKRDTYVSQGQSLLTRSLHPFAYENNPAFARLIERTGLKFRSYDRFDSAAQEERQELYLRLAEWVWNPSRLDLDGEKPVIPEPLDDPEDHEEAPVERSVRREMRFRFWSALIEKAKATKGLHGHLSPRQYHWLGVRDHDVWWNFIALQRRVRVELYFDRADAKENKALFDQVAKDRAVVEKAFGGPLEWQRLDDKRAARISTTIDGGWVDEGGWNGVIDQALNAMRRLHGALDARVTEAERSVLREDN